MAGAQAESPMVLGEQLSHSVGVAGSQCLEPCVSLCQDSEGFFDSVSIKNGVSRWLPPLCSAQHFVSNSCPHHCRPIASTHSVSTHTSAFQLLLSQWEHGAPESSKPRAKAWAPHILSPQLQPQSLGVGGAGRQAGNDKGRG